MGLVQDETARLRQNGTGRGWDCNTMEPLLDGTAAQWNWYRMGLRRNGIVTAWDVAQWDCYRMGLRQNEIGTGLDWYRRGL